MGKGMKSIKGAVDPKMVSLAYKFVASQETRFLENDPKLHKYYAGLRKYCEPRLPLWGFSINSS